MPSCLGPSALSLDNIGDVQRGDLQHGQLLVSHTTLPSPAPWKPSEAQIHGLTRITDTYIKKHRSDFIETGAIPVRVGIVYGTAMGIEPVTLRTGRWSDGDGADTEEKI